MRTYKMILFLISFIFCSFLSEAQNHRFYLRTINQNFNPSFTLNKGKLTYNGTDVGLKKVFNENDIHIFQKAFTNSRRSNLQRTWYIEGNSPDIVNQFLQFASHIFDYGEYLGTQAPQLARESYQKDFPNNSKEKSSLFIPFANPVEDYTTSNSMLFYPNDYGATSPVPNLGLEAPLDSFDFIGTPEAWYYTTGSSNIILGLSDAQILINYQGLTDDDPDFVDKTTTFYDLPGSLGANDPHGYSVGMRMAGQGNNGTGSTGICYDCPIYATRFGNYNTLLALSYEGVRVINCSWGSPDNSPTQQECIDEIVDNGTIIVAASQNLSNYPQGSTIYPAAYDNVIAVGGVSHKNIPSLDIVQLSNGGVYFINAPRYYLGGNVLFSQFPTQEQIDNGAGQLAGTSILGDWVDILAPGNSIFSYGPTLINDEISIVSTTSQATSAATPHVTGTIGLMLDINQCLSPIEIESILKITSVNINHIQANLAFEGLYGSGSLHTGTSVKLVNDLLDPTETAYLENQKFTRWDFEFKGVSEKIEIRNQEFTDGSTLNVVAKNRILIEEDSLLEPNSDGNALLVIDPTLTLDTICDPPGFTDTTDPVEIRQAESIMYKVYPTKVTSIIALEKIGNADHTISKVIVYDLFNRIVYSNDTLEDLKNNDNMEFDLSGLKRGIYILKGYGASNEEIVTEKIIKE